MKSQKSALTFALFLLTGIVLGGLLGEVAKDISFLGWLGYGQTFGIDINNPLVLDFSVVQLKFGLVFKLNIAVIITIIASLLIYKRIM